MVGGILSLKTEFHLEKWNMLLEYNLKEWNNHAPCPFIVHIHWRHDVVYDIDLCHDVIYYLKSGRKRMTYTRLNDAIEYMDRNPYDPIPSLRRYVYSQVDCPGPRKYAARCQKLAQKDEERYFTDESYRDLLSLGNEDLVSPEKQSHKIQ